MLLASCVFAPFAAQAQETIFRNGQTFVLRLSGVPADEVAVVSSKYGISDSGMIRLPYLRTEIKATGLKPSELAKKIEHAYKIAQIYTRPTVQVDPSVDPQQRFISVIGEVKSPGSIIYTPGLRLLDAIAQSGGFTDFADTKRVKLTRGTKVTYHRLSGGDPAENVTLQPNDIVTVKSRGFPGFR